MELIIIDLNKELIDIETLYKDHVKDMMRWHAIPTEMDSIPDKKLKF